MLVKLHKHLAQSGLCSRRKASEYILSGKISVNGKIAEIWSSVDPDIDTIVFDNQVVADREALVYYAYHKPRGIETTCRPGEGTSIVDVIDVPERVFPIGRLDKESTGLLLLTNDGRLSNYLLHPRYGHEKEYVVETFGPISDSALVKLWRGVMVLGRLTRECRVERVGSGRFSIVLKEGRNRQIRRMVQEIGGMVKKLKRIRVENIELWDLEPGDLRKLTKSELAALFWNIERHMISKNEWLQPNALDSD
jgi:23S rRNA pseudouridine2605 synthase